MKTSKKLTALFLALVLTIAAGIPVLAHTPAYARTINIHDVQGNDARLVRTPGGEATTPRGGQPLRSGNVLSTGRLSSIYLAFGAVSILKMDETSRVAVTASGNRLSLTVQQGAVLVEVEQQAPGEILEVLKGNQSFSVRGTSFIIGNRPHEPSGTVFVTMLEGSGEMRIPGVPQEVIVPAGTMLTVADDPGAQHQLHGFDINIMGLFELGEVYDRRDVLLDVGFITPDQVVQIPVAIAQREIERQARWAAEDARAGIVPTPTPQPTPTPIRTQFRTNANVQMLGNPAHGGTVMGTIPTNETVWVYGDGQLPQPANWVWASWERHNQAAVRGYVHSNHLVPLHAPLVVAPVLPAVEDPTLGMPTQHPETAFTQWQATTLPTTVSTGDIIPFGNYNWRVLDVQGSQALIITESVIFFGYYHASSDGVTWETSDIRHYLNNDFFNRFNHQDQNRIATRTIINNDNQWFRTDGGNATSDRVFLLSLDEVIHYFGDSGQLNNRIGTRISLDDAYNANRVAWNLDGSASVWWLRSPGGTSSSAAVVNANGIINMNGRVVFQHGLGALIGSGAGIRPAMWINLAP